MTNFLQAFDPSTGKAKQCVVVEDWPIVAKDMLTNTKDMAQDCMSGRLLGVLSRLLTLFQKCAQQEHLGEYSGFFKFAHKTNHFHPQGLALEDKDQFDLHYKYHYKTKPFDPSSMRIRHLPRDVYQFLDGVYRGNPSHAAALKQSEKLCSIQLDPPKQVLAAPRGHDIRLFADQLISIAWAHPQLCDLTTVLGHSVVAMNTLLPPPTVSLFAGREQALKALKKSLQAKQQRIIAPPITGPGGIGKTQLALRVMKQQAQKEQYAHVFWIPAESEEKLIDAYLQLAEGLCIYVDKQDAKQAVRNVRLHLKDQHCLYIFDDAQNIAAIQDFLPLAKGHVLITSRNSAREAWSTKPLQMAPLSEQEALSLAKSFGFARQRSTQEAMKSLLARFPRHPLTLVQLFSTLDKQGLTLQEFFSAMQDYTVDKQDQELLDLLSKDPHARVGYDKSTLYVFKTSLECLSKEHHDGEEAQQLLGQLAYLDPKGIPLNWLLSWDQEDPSLLHGKIRSLLSLLEKYSLIQWDRDARQVYIHATVQVMVRHLHPQSTLTGLIHRLVDYVGNEEAAYQNAAKWSSLLPHGRMLFERLATAQYPQEAYTLTKYLAKACRVTCLLKEGVSWAEKQLEICQKLFPRQDHQCIASSLRLVGASLRHTNNYQKALEYCDQALSMYKRLYEKQNSPEIAHTLITRGWILEELASYQEALDDFNEALTIYKAKGDGREVIIALNSIGWVYTRLSNYQEAKNSFKEALEIGEKIYPDQDHPNTARALDGLGRSLVCLGKSKEALEYTKPALAMYQRLYQEQDHPQVARSFNSVGWCYGELGKYEHELSYYEKSLEMRKRLYKDNDHLGIARSLHNIGWSLGKSGNYPEALTYFTQALEMYQRIYPNNEHPQVALALDYSSLSLRKTGNQQEALESLEKALKIYTDFYKGPYHSDIARVLNHLGTTLSELNKLPEALTYYKRAICMALRVYKGEHPRITQYLNHLIAILKKIEDQALIQQTKDEVLPLCSQYLGERHVLTQQLRDAEK